MSEIFTYFDENTKNRAVSTISHEHARELVEQMNNNKCTNCYNCYNCAYCAYCIDCTDCTDCIYCYICNNCTDCTYCTKCIYCNSQPINITGFHWNICIRKNKTIKIGCQDHSLSFWKNACDETISKMDKDAVEFWNKNKNMIISIAESFTQDSQSKEIES